MVGSPADQEDPVQRGERELCPNLWHGAIQDAVDEEAVDERVRGDGLVVEVPPLPGRELVPFHQLERELPLRWPDWVAVAPHQRLELVLRCRPVVVVVAISQLPLDVAFSLDRAPDHSRSLILGVELLCVDLVVDDKALWGVDEVGEKAGSDLADPRILEPIVDDGRQQLGLAEGASHPPKVLKRQTRGCALVSADQDVEQFLVAVVILPYQRQAEHWRSDEMRVEVGGAVEPLLDAVDEEKLPVLEFGQLVRPPGRIQCRSEESGQCLTPSRPTKAMSTIFLNVLKCSLNQALTFFFSIYLINMYQS